MRPRRRPRLSGPPSLCAAALPGPASHGAAALFACRPFRSSRPLRSFTPVSRVLPPGAADHSRRARSALGTSAPRPKTRSGHTQNASGRRPHLGLGDTLTGFLVGSLGGSRVIGVGQERALREGGVGPRPLRHDPALPVDTPRSRGHRALPAPRGPGRRVLPLPAPWNRGGRALPVDVLRSRGSRVLPPLQPLGAAGGGFSCEGSWPSAFSRTSRSSVMTPPLPDKGLNMPPTRHGVGQPGTDLLEKGTPP